MLNFHIRNRNTEPLRNDRELRAGDFCTVSLTLDSKGNPAIRFQYKDDQGELKVLMLGMNEFLSVKICEGEKNEHNENI